MLGLYFSHQHSCFMYKALFFYLMCRNKKFVNRKFEGWCTVAHVGIIGTWQLVMTNSLTFKSYLVLLLDMSCCYLQSWTDWNGTIISPSPPPQSNDEGAKEQKHHHWNGGRGGPDVPFSLSKIVGEHLNLLRNQSQSSILPSMKVMNPLFHPLLQ